MSIHVIYSYIYCLIINKRYIEINKIVYSCLLRIGLVDMVVKLRNRKIKED